MEMATDAVMGHTPVGANMCSAVERAGDIFSDRIAVIAGDEQITYAELCRRMRSAAAELRELGVQPGDRVMSLGSNCAELLVLYVATAYVGGVSVPLNALLLAEEISELIERVQPSLFFVHPSAKEKAEAATTASSVRLVDLLGADGWTAGIAPHEGDAGHYYTGDGPATIVFTSGSTDKPKGCVKTHSNMLWAAVNHNMAWPRTAEDRELLAVPLAGIGFANFVLLAALVGSAVVLLPFEPAAVLDAIEKHKVTCAFLAATMLDSLMEEELKSGQRDLSSLRQLQLAYETSESLRQRIAARFPGIAHYSYGSTEGGLSSAREGNLFLDVPTCVGKASGLTTFGIMSEDGTLLPQGETGEIVIAGPDVMLEYLDDPASTYEALHDGWLHSGDLGYLDEDGSLHYVGRFKDMIKSGGVSVAAAEVERCLTGHPAVRDAAVIGVPDDHWGEAVHAIVELHTGASVEISELQELCREGLAAFKRPKSISIIDALPRNPGGKVAKGVLKSDYIAENK